MCRSISEGPLTVFERTLLDYITDLSRGHVAFDLEKAAYDLGTSTSTLGTTIGRLGRANRLQFDVLRDVRKRTYYAFTGPAPISTPMPSELREIPRTGPRRLAATELQDRILAKESGRAQHVSFWLAKERAPRARPQFRPEGYIDIATQRALQGF